MALTLSAKPVGADQRYSWPVPVVTGDSLASAVPTVTDGSAVIEAYDTVDNSLVMFISGGAAGETTIISVVATTNDGETLSETLYLPVVSPNSSAATVEDIVSFALRKIYGIGETPPADAAEHAVECLSDMLEMWRVTGADIGAPRPLETSTILYAPESYLSAIKNNLIVQASEVFDREVTPTVAMNAARGLQHIKSLNLPDLREPADYF